MDRVCDCHTDWIDVWLWLPITVLTLILKPLDPILDSLAVDAEATIVEQAKAHNL